MASLLALAWLLPNHSAPWYSFHSEVLAAAAGGVLFALAIQTRWTSSASVPRSALVLLLVALVPWMQWLFGKVSFFGDALIANLYIAGAALCIWAAYATAQRYGLQLRRALAYAILWSSIASSGIAAIEWFGPGGLDLWALETPTGARAVANLGQPNHLAVLLMFGLASTAWLKSRDEIGGWTALLAGSLLVLGASLTASRTPWLGLLALAAWAAWAKSAKLATRGPRLAAIVLALEYCVAYWALQIREGSIAMQIAQATHERLQPGLRPLMWSQFLQALQESPWIGYGWQGGQSAQATAALTTPGLEVTVYAHNMLLDLMVWNGVPLGALLGGLLLIWYVRMGLRVRENGEWFPFALITFALLHALVEYPHAYVYFLVPIGFAAGQLEASVHRAIPMKLPRWLMLAMGLSTVAAITAICLDYELFADDRREVMLWRAKIGGDRALAPPPRARVLDQLAASARWARQVPRSGMTESEIDEQQTLARRFPSVFLMRQSVMVLALNARPQEAVTELHRLRGLQGEVAYQATVVDVQRLADDGRPGMLRLAQLIDAMAPTLPPLPKLSEAMAGRGS